MTLALILFLFAVDGPESQPQYLPMFGTVKSVDADAATFDLKFKSRTSTVSVPEKCQLRLLKRATLGDVTPGSSVYVLGLKKEVNWGSGTTVEVHKVQAVVAAKEFMPPAVPTKMAKEGFAWHQGNLTHESAQNKYFIDQQTWVHGNQETVAYIGEEMKREKLFSHFKRNKIVWVEARTVDKKNVEARRLLAFVGKVPKKELPLLVDLGGKKRKKS